MFVSKLQMYRENDREIEWLSKMKRYNTYFFDLTCAFIFCVSSH